MPYTPDATDVANPADVGIAANTAPSEFRSVKTYLRDLVTGTVDFLGDAVFKNTKGVKIKNAGGTARYLMQMDASNGVNIGNVSAPTESAVAFYANSLTYVVGGATRATVSATGVVESWAPQANFRNASADAAPYYLVLLKSRGTFSAPAAVQANDALGQLQFYGRDATTDRQAAAIYAYAEAAPATNTVPGALVFMTTPAGVSQIPLARMILSSAGKLGVGGIPSGAFEIEATTGAIAALTGVKVASGQDVLAAYLTSRAWNPAIVGGTSAGAATSPTWPEGLYERVGGTILANLVAKYANHTGSGDVRIPLPVAATSAGEDRCIGSGFGQSANGIDSNPMQLTAVIPAGVTTYCVLYYSRTASSNQALKASIFPVQAVWTVQIQYRV